VVSDASSVVCLRVFSGCSRASCPGSEACFAASSKSTDPELSQEIARPVDCVCLPVLVRERPLMHPMLLGHQDEVCGAAGAAPEERSDRRVSALAEPEAVALRSG
jgi:hypothetical protein